MRALLFDEIRPPDMERLAQHLAQHLTTSGLPEVFWLELPPELLSAEQAAHADCGPHRVALVLEEDSLKLELLVRGASLHCSCTAYADAAQRQWLLEFGDRLLAELDIRT
ncbi:MAG: hypothetical protein C4525_11360 [Desulfarculus sp.]|jgi:hypothetical protein|nr:MAG: hypothetical protein C4525_11360 [Desulfarculus sp.]